MHGGSKMKRILALLLAAFVFFACSDDTGTNLKNEEVPSSVVGWRSAGFTPVISFEQEAVSKKWFIQETGWS